MFMSIEEHGRVTQERIEREIATAQLLRQARGPAPSIRQSVGRRIVRFGSRLAAEPTFESVRPC